METQHREVFNQTFITAWHLFLPCDNLTSLNNTAELSKYNISASRGRAFTKAFVEHDVCGREIIIKQDEV